MSNIKVGTYVQLVHPNMGVPIKGKLALITNLEGISGEKLTELPSFGNYKVSIEFSSTANPMTIFTEGWTITAIKPPMPDWVKRDGECARGKDWVAIRYTKANRSRISHGTWSVVRVGWKNKTEQCKPGEYDSAPFAWSDEELFNQPDCVHLVKED